MSIEDLTTSSAAVVIGTVEQVRSGTDRERNVITQVDLRVEETLKGDVPSATLTLRELGGEVGGVRETVSGAPRYGRGERVVVFVDRGPNGILRTNHLALGQFVVIAADGGAALAEQRLGSDTSVIVRPGTTWRPVLPLADLVARVHAAAASDARAVIALPADGGAAARADGATITEEVSQPFTRQGLGRFFEADEGLPVAFSIDQNGDALLGLDVARAAVGDALRTWTDVQSASVVLSDAGLTADLSAPCEAGRHIVRFNDPNNQIPDPVGCSGVLGVGGSCSTDADQKLFSGQLFHRSLRGLVTFADHWDGCDVWNACNLAEVATHEIGHAIGLGHSSEDPEEADTRLTAATMYFLSRFDGRCAGLRMDDTDGVSFIYPTQIPPTITSSDMLPDGTTTVAYSTQLTGIGGNGPLAWSVVSDQSCTGFPGLELSSAGVLTGVPTAFGNGCFLIRAVAPNASSHMKRFFIEVHIPGAPSHTPTPSRTPTDIVPTNTVGPTRTPTLTSTATVPPTATPPTTSTSTPVATSTAGAVCTGDCNSNGFVAIDELVRGVNIALDRADVAECRNVDQSGDGTVSVNELVLAVNNALRGCP